MNIYCWENFFDLLIYCTEFHKIYPFLTDFHSTLVIGLQGLSFPSLPIWAENMYKYNKNFISHMYPNAVINLNYYTHSFLQT